MLLDMELAPLPLTATAEETEEEVAETQKRCLMQLQSPFTWIVCVRTRRKESITTLEIYKTRAKFGSTRSLEKQKSNQISKLELHQLNNEMKLTGLLLTDSGGFSCPDSHFHRSGFSYRTEEGF
ncbi:hypothetical protein Ahy_A04g018263 isoform B [Arachis hypogaea]|uniref:Uncharacterized protein n=1 Tax=Arachis hypogaea TaxID=3818 RepID=A0A445DDB1_ARAHY|nr:hypothetical protein Ahy_A04g018263 isoform B [Arachis hypogaea]